MEIQSILEIKQSIQTIDEGLNQFSRVLRKLGFKETDIVAKESEYNLKGLLGGISVVLIDCKTLVNAPHQFISKASISERRSIADLLKQIATSINSTKQQFNEFQQNKYSVVDNKILTFSVADGSQHQLAIVNCVDPLENLKPIIRNLGVRHSPERQQELDKLISELQRQLTNLTNQKDQVGACVDEAQKLLTQVENIKDEITAKSNDVNAPIVELKEFISQTARTRDELTAKIKEYEEIASAIEAVKKQADEILTGVKSNEGVIEQFSKRVNQREQQLEQQEAKTQAFENKLTDFEKERNEALARTHALITEASNALKLSAERKGDATLFRLPVKVA